MKKSLFLLFASFSFIAANAQQITSKKGFPVLPEKGDWSISFGANPLLKYIGDLAFNPGSSVPDVDPATYDNLDNRNQIGNVYIVGKKFITDKTAYRAVLGFQFDSKTEKTTTEKAIGDQTNVNKLRTTNLDLYAGLGKEWRRGKTRLQGYYGADVLLNVAFPNRTKETNSLTNFGGFKSEVNNDGTVFGIGAQGFIGAEYFVLPKMALGAQYDMGFMIRFQGRGKSETTPWTGPVTGGKNPNSESGFELGNIGVTSIRLSLYF